MQAGEKVRTGEIGEGGREVARRRMRVEVEERWHGRGVLGWGGGRGEEEEGVGWCQCDTWSYLLKLGR